MKCQKAGLGGSIEQTKPEEEIAEGRDDSSLPDHRRLSKGRREIFVPASVVPGENIIAISGGA